jgi:F-type H+-transporting ATPase subunit gamma
MANLKAIRTRIGSVKNTQQITRAMKMVAAAKLRRAQDSMMQGRPYALNLKHTIHRLARKMDPEQSKLLRKPTSSRTLLLVVTSDRGLCGAFNSNIIRTTERFIEEKSEQFDSVDVGFIGRKGYDYFRRRLPSISHYFRDIFADLNVENVKDDISSVLLQEFTDEKYDQLFIIYNEFRSVVSQDVKVQQLLPLAPAEESFVDGEEHSHDDGSDYIYEPDQESLLEHLLPLYVTNAVYSALRESFAAEMGARMSAMENATNNASEMIGKLTLAFNRARQAAITTEIIEIVSGAEAL